MRVDWRCLRRCGECCSTAVSFPKQLISDHMKDYQVTPTITFLHHTGKTTILTEDGYCVFLHRVTAKCTIYEDRPVQCRLYGLDPRQPCPYIRPDGTERSKEEKQKNRQLVKRAVEFATKGLKGKEE